MVTCASATGSHVVPKPAKTKTRARRPGTTGVERTAASDVGTSAVGAGGSPGSGAAPFCVLMPEHPATPTSINARMTAAGAGLTCKVHGVGRYGLIRFCRSLVARLLDTCL